MTALFVDLVLYLVVCAGVCAAALVLGGVTERRVAIGLLVAVAASNLGSALTGHHWRGANWGVIVVDAVFLGWLVAVACRSDRFWPLWAAASQLAGFLAHLPAIVLPHLPLEVYATTQPFWAFPLLASLLVGTVANRRPMLTG